MLPNTDDLPSKAVQFAVHMPVPFAICRNFSIPEFLIATWSLVALRATVPETAVYKNNNPFAPEGEIRLAQKRLIAPPAGDAVLSEDCNQAQLRRLVAARADQ